jgi:two-component system NtrC family sensor kinase
LQSLVQKRVSLHRNLAKEKEQNNQLRRQLSQVQSLANIGIISCMIAHEINNLLTPIGNYARLALSDISDEELVTKTLQKTVRNCEQAARIQDSMLAMTNGQSQDKQKCNLKSLVDDAFCFMSRDLRKDRIRVNVNVPERLEIWAVPIQIQHVMMNLILNAREAMLPKGGILTISGRQEEDKSFVEVADTGKGINPSEQSNVFKPFFTTKKRHKDSTRSTGGLGLTFCKDIVEAHSGSISVDSQPGKGTKFTITLPKMARLK